MTWTRKSTVWNYFGTIIRPFRLRWKNSSWSLFPTTKLWSYNVDTYSPQYFIEIVKMIVWVRILILFTLLLLQHSWKSHWSYWLFTALWDRTLCLKKQRCPLILLLWLQITCSVKKNPFLKILKGLIFHLHLSHCFHLPGVSVECCFPNFNYCHSICQSTQSYASAR